MAVAFTDARAPPGPVTLTGVPRGTAGAAVLGGAVGGTEDVEAGAGVVDG
jgi:hypothetical protein